MKLSNHFTLEEFLKTSHPELQLKEPIDPLYVENLGILCRAILEPIRYYSNCKILITSGLRSEDLNKKVGGVSDSKHLTGGACDFRFDSRLSPRKWVPFLFKHTLLSKLIYYPEELRFHVEIDMPARQTIYPIRKKFYISLSGKTYHDFTYLV